MNFEIEGKIEKHILILISYNIAYGLLQSINRWISRFLIIIFMVGWGLGVFVYEYVFEIAVWKARKLRKVNLARMDDPCCFLSCRDGAI